MWQRIITSESKSVLIEILTENIKASYAVDIAQSQAAGAVASVQCTEADHCPCADPETCCGTIVINLKVPPGTADTVNVTGNWRPQAARGRRRFTVAQGKS